jgi:alkylation response protein AidB-like acyl-CoA dehydrogenase
MNFELAPEHEAFRKEFRDWLAVNLPPELCLDDPADDRVASDRETFERRRAWQRQMHEAGWVGIAWPQEYGDAVRGLMGGHLGRGTHGSARAARQHGPQPVGPTIIHWNTPRRSPLPDPQR